MLTSGRDLSTLPPGVKRMMRPLDCRLPAHCFSVAENSLLGYVTGSNSGSLQARSG